MIAALLISGHQVMRKWPTDVVDITTSVALDLSVTINHRMPISTVVSTIAYMHELMSSDYVFRSSLRFSSHGLTQHPLLMHSLQRFPPGSQHSIGVDCTSKMDVGDSRAGPHNAKSHSELQDIPQGAHSQQQHNSVYILNAARQH